LRANQKATNSAYTTFDPTFPGSAAGAAGRFGGDKRKREPDHNQPRSQENPQHGHSPPAAAAAPARVRPCARSNAGHFPEPTLRPAAAATLPGPAPAASVPGGPHSPLVPRQPACLPRPAAAAAGLLPAAPSNYSAAAPGAQPGARSFQSCDWRVLLEDLSREF